MATQNKSSVGTDSANTYKGNIRNSDSETGVTAGMDRLMAVVDQAVERISNKNERHLVREGVANVIRNTLIEIANEQEAKALPAASDELILAQAVSGSSAQTGINVAKQVK